MLAHILVYITCGTVEITISQGCLTIFSESSSVLCPLTVTLPIIVPTVLIMNSKLYIFVCFEISRKRNAVLVVSDFLFTFNVKLFL